MELTIKKICPKHGLTDFFYSKTENKYRCKECRKDAVIDKRRKNKIQLVNYKGGKCEICGYDKCIDALEFHHINEETKSFEISNGNIRSLKDLKKEADKCILVCSNCHKEIHAKKREEELYNKKLIIEKNLEEYKQTTDYERKHKYRYPQEKDIESIKVSFSKGKSNTDIAKEFNFSLTTLRRFLKKNNIKNPNTPPNMKNYTKQQLIEDLKELGNFSAIGRRYGLSYTAIKKWCSRNNLPIHLKDLKKEILT